MRLVLLLLGATLLSRPAAALQIDLSDLSNSEIPASVLGATLEFDVSGTTLTLTVTNGTTAPDAYAISAIYFNASSDVTGLSLESVGGNACPPCNNWQLKTPTGPNGGANNVGGFGVFDFAVIGGSGNAGPKIASGTSLAFVFTISGTGPFDMDDFDATSLPDGDNPPVRAAAKFVNGPEDASSFGGNVPGPPLLGAWLLALLAVGARLGRVGGA